MMPSPLSSSVSTNPADEIQALARQPIVVARTAKVAGKDQKAITSTIEAKFDATGKGEIVVTNFSDKNGAPISSIEPAKRSALVAEYVKFEIDCSSDPAKMKEVASLYQSIRNSLNRDGSIKSEADLNAALNTLNAKATAVTKNTDVEANKEVLFTSLFDAVNPTPPAPGNFGVQAPVLVAADNVEHAINVLLNRHTLVFKNSAATAGAINEMHVICDKDKVHLVLKGAGRAAMRFELDGIINPVGEKDNLNARAQELVERLTKSPDGYLEIFMRESAVGEAICTHSELFKTLLANERAVHLSDLNIVDSPIIIRAASSGLKLENVKLEGKNCTSNLVIDGKVDINGITTNGSTHIHINSKAPCSITGCSRLTKGTVLSGNMKKLVLGAGVTMKNSRVLANIADLTLEGTAGPRDFAGTFFAEHAVPEGSPVIGKLSLEKLTDKNRMDNIQSSVNKVLSAAAIQHVFENSKIFKVEKDAAVGTSEYCIVYNGGDTPRSVVVSQGVGESGYRLRRLDWNDTNSEWIDVPLKQSEKADGASAFAEIFSVLMDGVSQAQASYRGFGAPENQDELADGNLPGRPQLSPEQMAQLMAAGGGAPRGGGGRRR